MTTYQLNFHLIMLRQRSRSSVLYLQFKMSFCQQQLHKVVYQQNLCKQSQYQYLKDITVFSSIYVLKYYALVVFMLRFQRRDEKLALILSLKGNRFKKEMFVCCLYLLKCQKASSKHKILSQSNYNQYQSPLRMK